MITTEQLNNQMIALSANLKGVQWFDNSLSSNDIEEQIKADITSYFDFINKVNVSVEIEEIEDERTFESALLFQLEMLLMFNDKIDYDDVLIIENYILKNFIKEF